MATEAACKVAGRDMGRQWVRTMTSGGENAINFMAVSDKENIPTFNDEQADKRAKIYTSVGCYRTK